VFAFVFPLVGLILSIIARGQIKRTGQRGSGLALAGLILSVVFLVLGIIVVIVAGTRPRAPARAAAATRSVGTKHARRGASVAG